MDISAVNWNEDDNANTSAAPDGAPEGMAPSGVNNVLRAHQGALKRYYSWTVPKTSGGTATNYTLGYAVAPGALVDGMTHLVQFHAVNDASATLNINNLGPVALHYHAVGAWRPVPPGLIDAQEIVRVAYHASSGAYRLLGFRNRTGEVVPYGGSAAPAGTLFCNGQQLSRTTYAGLFAAIGGSFGAPDGATFLLPDLRGRVAAGKDDMGGVNAGRLSAVLSSASLGGVGGGSVNTAFTSVGGSATGGVTVTSVAMDGPNLTWSVADGPTQVALASHTHANVVSIGTANLTVSASGASGAFSIVQPTIILNHLIRI
jgi:microcystin-dependent protein